MHQQHGWWLTRLERGDHAINGGLGRVHGGNDSAYQAAILDLKAVDGIGLIRDFSDPEILVEIVGELTQRNAGGHPRLRTSGSRAGALASIVLGRGAATNVPAAMESAAARIRVLKPAGIRLSIAEGTYLTTPLLRPNASTWGLKLPATTSDATR